MFSGSSECNVRGSGSNCSSCSGSQSTCSKADCSTNTSTNHSFAGNSGYQFGAAEALAFGFFVCRVARDNASDNAANNCCKSEQFTIFVNVDDRTICDIYILI